MSKNKKINKLKKKTSKAISQKKKLNSSALTMIITGVCVFVIALCILIPLLVKNKQEQDDLNFDYLTSDLSKYIEMSPENYKNYKVNLSIAKPKAIDVDVTILNLLASKKGGVLNSGVAVESGTITPGDIVNIYYRGYLVDAEGTEVSIDNMCNYASKDSSGNYVYASLEIGCSRFLPGFELGLSGKSFSSANKFVRITSGQTSAEQVLYISYKKVPEGSTSDKDKSTVSAERVDLTAGKEAVDAKYGEGFYDKLLTLTVASADGATFDATISSKKYKLSELKVDFATTCEKEGTYFLIDCYFPYDYGATNLNNKNARFEVYVQSVVEYEEQLLTNEFIEENLGKDDFGVTAEDLEEYEGDRVSQLRQHVKALLDEEYEEIYRTQLEEAMWEHYHKEEITAVSGYPKLKVDAIYEEYYQDVLYQFEYSGGVITDALGTSKTCESVDEYAVIYLGLEYSSNQDWRAVLRSMSEGLVKERLILYYIMRQENLLPTPEEHAAKKAEVKEEYFEEYIYQYCEEYSIDKSTYSEEDWAKFEADRNKELNDYYNDSYFDEVTYYEIALDAFLAWPTVTTMDTIETATK